MNKQQSLLTTAFKVLNPLAGDYILDRQKLFKDKSVTFLYKEAKKFNKKQP